MSNWQHQMAMTYYRMMKGIRSKVDLNPTQIRSYMDIAASLALPSIGFEVFDQSIGDVKIETVKHKSSKKGRCCFSSMAVLLPLVRLKRTDQQLVF